MTIVVQSASAIAIERIKAQDSDATAAIESLGSCACQLTVTLSSERDAPGKPEQ